MEKFLRQSALQENEKTRKENLFQTNETMTLPNTRQAMWSMPEKKCLDKKTKNLCNGGQSGRRTVNEMQEVNAPTTWPNELTISWMDDNLDVLVPLAIQWPKESSRNMINQQANKSNKHKHG